jgi:hypothetical protein
LQALALRTKNIYTTNLVEVKSSGTEIFVDIESIPEQRFHYLIGVLVISPDGQQYHPFWADEVSDERNIWIKFLEFLRGYPSAQIFHYGSYEKKVFMELSIRYDTNVDEILERLCNLNGFIYGRIYFPTRSNRLKDICSYIGCVWSAEDANGLNSIVWRNSYDKLKEAKIREDLILYNKEDCFNLNELKSVVSHICSNDSIAFGVMAANDENQLLSATSKEIVSELTSIVKSAHGKYEQSKISLKNRIKSKKKLEQQKKNGLIKKPKLKVEKIIRVARGRMCPIHKRKLSPTNIISEVTIIDLLYTSRGLKRTNIRYWGYKGRCPNCSYRHNPPRLRKLGRNAKYGSGLKAWIAYQRLTMRLPLGKITQLLEDSFGLEISDGVINHLLKKVSSDYKITENYIFRAMMKSSIIHVDETLVNIQGKTQYVWVFTDGIHVFFKLTPTRDSSVVHEILDGFGGVLISDFFPGYDSIKCSQQKCWVHLIRDINNDMRKSPFDSELEMFVLELRNMIIPIFDAVSKYGLKKRNLNKFRASVDKFYESHVDGKCYASDIVNKYLKRLIRYRHSLFVFLERDHIPWNNNMAERALRHLAVQRKISGSFFASGMSDYLVMLGVMQTCRFQNKPFLAFLMSGSKNVDEFKGKKNIIGWMMK